MSDASASVPAAAGVPLDVAARGAWRALAARNVRQPQTLLFLGAGLGLWGERLDDVREHALGEPADLPGLFQGARLLEGDLAGHRVWCVEDPTDEPARRADAGAWERAFPVWLAAVAGARLMVHTSAGAALAGANAPPRGGFALISDHLNLSGGTPLLGLGESTLGPLFPDQSRVHHHDLRRAAGKRAAALGLEATEAIAACTAGPSVETPAERAFFARAGADVAVQGLASPLIAAAHAGLRALAVVAIVDAGDAPTRLRDIVAAAEGSQAALEDLVAGLGPDLHAAYRDAEDEV